MSGGDQYPQNQVIAVINNNFVRNHIGVLVGQQVIEELT